MKTVGLEWTVMTWNIQGTKRTDIDQVAAVIRAEAPDVVLIQEVRRSQADELCTRLSMTSTWHEKHNPFHPLLPSRSEGSAILTPHSLRSPGHLVISDEPSIRSYKRRIVQWATVERSDHSAYRSYNLHLSPHDMTHQRADEARRITAIVAEQGESPPVIVAGDLNDTNDPELVTSLPGIEHVPSPPTNPADHPTQALDHVLLPADANDVALTAPSGGPQWAALADHLPVTVRFTLDWVQGGFGT